MKATKVPVMKPGRRKVGANVFSVFVSIKRISNWKLKFVNVFFFSSFYQIKSQKQKTKKKKLAVREK